MSKQIIAMFLTLILLVGTYSFIFFFSSNNENDNNRVVDGKLNLSTWQLTRERIISLNGEWEFYPNVLLSHVNEIEPPNHPLHSSLKIQVPGTWNSVLGKTGVATYRLQLYSSDSTVIYGIKTSSIYMSNKLYLNGKEIGKSGVPNNQSNYKALNKPYVTYFPLQAGWNEIIIQVANHDFPIESGIVEPLYFGTAEQISMLRDKAMAHDWISISTFLLMGLYFLGLYSQRRSDSSWLTFSMLCIFIAIFTSTRGERLLFHIIGDIPFQLNITIQMVAAALAGVSILLYTYTALGEYCYKWMFYVGLIVGILLAVCYLVAAPYVLSVQLRYITTLFVSATLVYAAYVFILAALHKVEGSIYLTVAAIALNIFTFKQNTSLYFGIPVYALPPIEPFLILIMLALLMSLRFTKAFIKNRELSDELLKADKMKDDFLARTSHEFKSPLHGIQHITQSIIQDSVNPLPEHQHEKLHLIVNLTNRLSQLVYDILDLSKLKHNVLHIAPTSINIHSIVDAQIHIYSYWTIDKNVNLINKVSKHLHSALADESRVSQIISNLLDNAIKHTKDGSVTVSANERNEMIIISVQDTGSGIAPDKMPYIFEPFNSANKGDGDHFGLGLSIVKQLVELQSGTLTVHSILGQGSTFTFTLLKAENQVASQEVSSQSYMAEYYPLSKNFEQLNKHQLNFATPLIVNPSGKHTILIVDDQFINLKILIDDLKAFNYKIIAVKNGYEALEQLHPSQKIDLVILDNMMPGISGYEVCQQIRRRYSIVELPVLMVTAAIQMQDKVTAFQAGANDYLPKPFDIEELRARIHSLLTMKTSFEKMIHMEIAFLQSQIKPHFLYNVLNTVSSLSYTDVESARTLITDFADYLRGSFRFSNTEERISFQEEYHLIQAYTKIERVRFGNRIRFEHDIEQEAFNLRIPPLIIQPLIENAIHHGLNNRIEGGIVTLTVLKIENEWIFTVKDNGRGISEDDIQLLVDEDMARSTNSVGLLNINKRLKYEYGISLEIDSKLGQGTCMSIRIPNIFTAKT